MKNVMKFLRRLITFYILKAHGSVHFVEKTGISLEILYERQTLINKFYIKSVCTEVYEGFHTWV